MPHARLRFKRKLSEPFDNSPAKEKLRKKEENKRREIHRKSCQKYRANLTDEQRAHGNKLSQKRMEKYRLRKKLKDCNWETGQKVKHNIHQKIVWEEKKAIQRAAMTEQQRQA